MQVLDYIRKNPSWEADLAGAPYFVTTKWSGRYFLLKYSQLDSDFHLPMVRECRGAIFRLDVGDAKSAHAPVYKCVCHPFDKFGNYGESYCPEIDWETVKVQEKLDGSLIKLWYDREQWHWSTNGTIHAIDAPLNNAYYHNYQELIDSAIGASFYELLDTRITYMFELVSPYNQVVIPYKQTRLVLIGARYNVTDKEYSSNGLDVIADGLGVERPKMYGINSLKDALAAVSQMDSDEEGFVVVDAKFNRVKIKSQEWLRAAHLHNNGVITTKRVLEAADSGSLDDMRAYCPDYEQFIARVLYLRDCEISNLNFLVDHEINWNLIKSKKDLALLTAKGYTSVERAYLFKFYESEGIRLSAADYFDSLPLARRCDIINKEMEIIKKFCEVKENANGD